MLASVVVLAYRSGRALEHCLASLATHRSEHKFETIVVLNGATTEVRVVADGYPEVLCVPSMANRGFGGGCNLGASQASGRYLVFLNDDAVVTDGWLDGLVHVATTLPQAGAVSSLVTDPHGSILEFGGGLDRLIPRALERGENQYRAELVGPQLVAYASGCSLLVDRALFESLGGFDEQFYPAYYEDTDLSCRIWGAGRVIAVTPASVVRHFESHSTSSPLKEVLFDSARATFERKWAGSPDVGAHLPEPLPRIVFVDDAVPRTQSGCGLSRARMNIDAFTSRGIFVQQVSAFDRLLPFELDQSLRSAGVVAVKRPEDLEGSPAPLCVLVSRPHNFRIARRIVRFWEGVPLIYDAEALFAARIKSQMSLAEYRDRQVELAATHADLLKNEISIAREADLIVAISPDEAEWFRKNGDVDVQLLEPFPDRCNPGSAQFAERSGAVFITGWMSGSDSPNADGVRWLAKEVMPRLEELAPDLVINVTGSAPPSDLLVLQSDRLRFVGEVADLDELLNSSRVAIAPIRYGSGVKHKVVDALVRGLPVVATRHGAEGIGGSWNQGIALADGPDSFATRLASIASDEDVWDSFRLPLLEQCKIHSSDLAESWMAIVDVATRVKSASSRVAG